MPRRWLKPSEISWRIHQAIKQALTGNDSKAGTA